MYIYNFDDNKGFAIISANKATEPLIAIADSGNISSIEDIDNPGLAMFIRAAENYISTSVCSNDSNLTDTMYLENNTRKNVGIRSVHDTIVSSSISPKLSVKWEQGSVEGSYCPNGTAGCTTIAIFQAMSYFYYPTSINFTFSDRIVDSYSLNFVNWENIKRHQSAPCYNCSEDRHKIIGHICREIGERCCCVYNIMATRSSINYNGSENSTSITFPNARTALTNFGFSTGNIMAYSSNCIRNNLTPTNLVMIAGRLEGTTDKGHAWIADGYRYYVVSHKMYAVDGFDTWLIDSGIETVNLVHYNWGWGGIGNGYFNENVFNSGNHNCLDAGCIQDSDNHNFVGIQYMTISTE